VNVPQIRHLSAELAVTVSIALTSDDAEDFLFEKVTKLLDSGRDNIIEEAQSLLQDDQAIDYLKFVVEMVATNPDDLLFDPSDVSPIAFETFTLPVSVFVPGKFANHPDLHEIDFDTGMAVKLFKKHLPMGAHDSTILNGYLLNPLDLYNMHPSVFRKHLRNISHCLTNNLIPSSLSLKGQNERNTVKFHRKEPPCDPEAFVLLPRILVCSLLGKTNRSGPDLDEIVYGSDNDVRDYSTLADEISQILTAQLDLKFPGAYSVISLISHPMSEAAYAAIENARYTNLYYAISNFLENDDLTGYDMVLNFPEDSAAAATPPESMVLNLFKDGACAFTITLPVYPALEDEDMFFDSVKAAFSAFAGGEEVVNNFFQDMMDTIEEGTQNLSELKAFETSALRPVVDQVFNAILSFPGDRNITLAFVDEDRPFETHINAEGPFDPEKMPNLALLKAKIDKALSKGGSLIVRQFLPLKVRKVADSGETLWIPRKKIYGFVLGSGGWSVVPAGELESSFLVDSEGAPVPKEAHVTFCEYNPNNSSDNNRRRRH
jgi:hypothetical protein